MEAGIFEVIVLAIATYGLVLLARVTRSLEGIARRLGAQADAPAGADRSSP